MSTTLKLVKLLLVWAGVWLWTIGGTNFALALGGPCRCAGAAPGWSVLAAGALLGTALGVPIWLAVGIRVAYTEYTDGMPLRHKWDGPAFLCFLLGLLLFELLPTLSLLLRQAPGFPF